MVGRRIVRGKYRTILKGYGFLFWHDDDVLKLIFVMVTHLYVLNILKIIESYSLNG